MTGRADKLLQGFAAGFRAAGFGLVFCAVTWSLTPIWQYGVYVGVAAALALMVERSIARRDAAGPGDAAENGRDSLARLMTLELAYDRSQSVLESLQEGVIVVDGGGEVVLANPAAWRALARPDVDPVGKVLWEELPPALAQAARETWAAMREEPSESSLEFPQVRHSSIPCGELFFDLTAVPVTSSETGQDFGTVFLFVDTTRNQELQRLKDRFLSSVSHELRTPLTTICAYSEILSSMVPGESMEWPEFVRAIHEEGVQLNQLVDGMFDFLQLESGDAEFDIEDVNAHSVLQVVVDDFAATAPARGIDLQVTSNSGGRAIRVDRRRFEQVCRNLLDNAVKFTPTGGRISVTCSEDDGCFEMRVDDSGPGVPIADRSNVFDKFTQLRDHLTDKPEGAGIGLAICRAIVGRCGGQIWCEDSPFGGAGLVVRLPLSTGSKVRSHVNEFTRA